MQKIRPFLWYDDQAGEAAKFYVSIFPNSKILNDTEFEGRTPDEKVTVVTFSLDGMEFMALNGGPHYKFSPATSFSVDCESQEEVDYFWEKLGEGGEYNQCGWLDDKFGVTWQIVPSILGDLLGDADDEKSQRTRQAMLKMIKLDIAELQKAHDGG